MIIFGWGGGRPKDFGPTTPSKCPNCNNQTFFHYYKSTKWFSLFFVPLIPYETRHLLLCPVCTRGMSLTRDQAARAKALAVSCTSWNAGQLTETEYLGQVNSFWEFLNPLEIADPNAGLAALGQKEQSASADIAGEGVPSGEWRKDPSGRHQSRFWDGSSWTEHVADAGKPAIDATLTPSKQGWYPDPEQRHAVRYWDGSGWTQHVQDDGEPALDAMAPGVD